MARPIGSKTRNGWVTEKLEVSNRLYEKISSNNLFKFYMKGEEKNGLKIKFIETIIET